MNEKNLQYYISHFLSTYLGGERGLSENTFISYNHVFKQLVPFFYERLGKPINKVTMEDFSADAVKDFLAYLENNGCSVATRNQRLAAIKTFARYVQEDSPMYLYNMQQILSIPTKRSEKPVIEYLSGEQLSMLLNAPDSNNRYGFKDLLILAVLADTGARVSEMINIKVADVRLDNPPQIKVTGKGNKSRFIPISSNTASLLKLYIDKENLCTDLGQDRYLFLNRSGRKFTRAGITYILQKYVDEVHQAHPLDFPDNLSPHCLRHTKAMLLLNAGQNLVYIRDILGHAHIKTTEVYARADSKQIRAALEKAEAQVKSPDPETISYQNQPELLSWLNDYCT